MRGVLFLGRIKTEKEHSDDKLALVMFLILLDFIFTYIGINYLEFISEANPFMVELFNLPVFSSLLLRLGHMIFIFIILIYIRKERFKLYLKILNFALFLNVGILFLHIHWILNYTGIL